MSLSGAINKLSLTSKLELLESSDKKVISLKFFLQSQVSKLSEIAETFVYQMLNYHMFSCCDMKMVYSNFYSAEKGISLHVFSF